MDGIATSFRRKKGNAEPRAVRGGCKQNRLAGLLTFDKVGMSLDLAQQARNLIPSL
jgi:hypothetical protein